MFNVDILRPLSVIRPLCLCIKNKKRLIDVNIRFARTHSPLANYFSFYQTRSWNKSTHAFPLGMAYQALSHVCWPGEMRQSPPSVNHFLINAKTDSPLCDNRLYPSQPAQCALLVRTRMLIVIWDACRTHASTPHVSTRHLPRRRKLRDNCAVPIWPYDYCTLGSPF